MQAQVLLVFHFDAQPGGEAENKALGVVPLQRNDLRQISQPIEMLHHRPRPRSAFGVRRRQRQVLARGVVDDGQEH